MYVYIYIYIYIYTHIFIYIFHIYICIYTYKYIFVQQHVLSCAELAIVTAAPKFQFRGVPVGCGNACIYIYNIYIHHTHIHSYIHTHMYLYSNMCWVGHGYNRPTIAILRGTRWRWHCWLTRHTSCTLRLLRLRCCDSILCVTRLIHECDVTDFYVWHDCFMRVTCLIEMCDMTYTAASWHSTPRAPWDSGNWDAVTQDVTHFYVWHFYLCDMPR